MSRIMIRGGSQGEPVRASTLPYFAANVKAVEFTSKNTFGFRILPAFEYDYTTMIPTSLSSFIPYRDSNNKDSETGFPVFTDWYFPLKCHKMIGRGKRSFLSPLILEQYDCKDRDPLHNVFLTAWGSENPDWSRLVEKKDGEKNAPVRKFRIFYAMNTLNQILDKVENRLSVITNQALLELKGKLNLEPNRSDTVLDPNWSDFKFGDITSPQYGLWLTAKDAVFDAKSQMRTCLIFIGTGTPDTKQEGVSPYPIDPNTDWGRQILESRYNIPDVIRPANPAEMLQYLVDDGLLPYELIQEACGHCWTVPPFRKQNTTVSVAEAGIPPTHSMPAMPSAPPVADTKKYYAHVGGQSVGPLSVIQVQSLVNLNASVPLFVEGMAEWQPASALGFSPVKAATQPPAPPVAPVTPTAPPAPPAAASVPPPPPRNTTMAPVPPPLARSGGLSGPPRPPVAQNLSTPPPMPGNAPRPPMATAPMPPRSVGLPGNPPLPSMAPPAFTPPPMETAAPASPVPTGLTEQDLARYKELDLKWTSGPDTFSPAELTEFLELSNRVSESNQAATTS